MELKKLLTSLLTLSLLLCNSKTTLANEKRDY